MIRFQEIEPITYDLDTGEFSGNPDDVYLFQNKTTTPAVPEFQKEIDDAKLAGHKPEKIKKAIDMSSIEDKPGAHEYLGSLFKNVSDFLGDSNKKALETVIPPKEIAITPVESVENKTQDRLIEAIAYNETGIISENKKYSFSQPSGTKNLGRALGKYQVTEGELKSYAERYLGRKVGGDEFLKSSEIQDQYVQGKIDYLRDQGYSDEDILAIHRGGMNVDKEKYKPYVEKGMKHLSSLGK